MRYKYLMLDFDGTLIDSAPAQLWVAEQLFSRLLGRKMSESDKLDAMAKPTEELYGGGEKTIRLMMQLYEQYQREHGVALFDGVLEVMTELRELGAVIAAVTARKLIEVKKEGAIKPLMPLLDYIMASDMTARPKPAPDPVHLFIEQTGAKSGEVLLLGDTYADCLCAKNAGIDFALATWGTLEPSLPAKYYPESIHEFKRIVMGLC